MRTYARQAGDDRLESWPEIVARSFYRHQKRLWEEQQGRELSPTQELELRELEQLGLEKKSFLAGRTLWLGGTDYAFSRPCSQFNCSAKEVKSIYDVVDIAWLLLNGSGTGFKPSVGILHGHVQPVREFKIIPSDKPGTYKGREANEEQKPEESNGYSWVIRVGDSAQAWAKAIGKMFHMHPRVNSLTLDYTEVRGAGEKLTGYQWSSNGSEPLVTAMAAIHTIRNERAGHLLTEINILDVINHVGTVLSSRRSAQIALMDTHNPSADEFRLAKVDYWKSGNNQRRQSNNTLMAWSKPSRKEFTSLLQAAYETGDPGLLNARAAKNKGHWFEYVNPCAEILLGAFCNLVTSVLPRFRKNIADLKRAIFLIARANYRQTCVNLDDGILQPTWGQSNDALRLCGVSLTGIVQAPWLTDYDIRQLRDEAVYGAHSMADELQLPRSKAVTTIKPEGSLSRIAGSELLGEVTEGIHKPLGKYIFNYVNFSIHDPLVARFESSGYRVLPNPADANNVLVCFPVSYGDIEFEKVDSAKGRLDVNLEPAVDQLKRYMRWNTLWADHNVSSTISFDDVEIPEIVDFLDANWDSGYIATAFLRRNNPLLRPEDLGHAYLPQVVVTHDEFVGYDSTLRAVDWPVRDEMREILDDGCATGACPIR